MERANSPSASQHRAPLTSRLGLFWLIGITLFFTLAILRAAVWHNHDVSWLQLATERLVNGGVLGKDILELNPPLILWLMAPPTLLSRWTDADFFSCYNSLVTAIAFLSSFLCYLIVKPSLTQRRAACFGIATAVALLGPIGYDFGQRDHLVIMFIAPYLVEIATSRAEQPTLRMELMVGILAAVGFLIKPYYAVVPTAFLAYEIARSRSLSPVFRALYISMIVSSILYIAVLFAFYREWIALSRITAEVYVGYNAPLTQLTKRFAGRSLVTASAILLIYFPRYSVKHWRVHLRFLIASGGLLAAGFLQLKGWSYHFLPGTLALFITFSYYFISTCHYGAAFRIKSLVMAGLLVSVVLMQATMLRREYIGYEKGIIETREIRGIIAKAHDQPFLAIASSLYPAFPSIMDQGGVWASRSPAQWLVPGIISRSHASRADRDTADRLRNYSSSLLAADLETYRPAIVAIRRRRNQAIADPFNWIAFLSAERRFRNAWRNYCPGGTSQSWLIYERCGSRAAPSGKAL